MTTQSIGQKKGIWNDNQFHIIAGPCAVEGREMLEQIAKVLSEVNVSYIRGGAYKPRTSPHSFQGLGIEGLQILREVATQYHLHVVSEIMDPRDIDQAEQYIDIIQVGSRNMQNFPLLKELGKLRKPVLLKRGLAASVDEWIQAAEYLKVGGNHQIILCERGIRTFESRLRNTLDFSGAYLAKQLSGYDMIIDPSHGTGMIELVEPMIQAARALRFQGAMVEIHPDPHNALSDGIQSMNLSQFKKMMAFLSLES